MTFLTDGMLRRGVGRVRLAPQDVFETRREQICDTICDIHECVISGCVATDTVGYLMDRLLSLDPRYTSGRQ